MALDGNGNLRPFVETVRCKRALVLNGKLFANRSEAAEAAEWLRTVGEEFRTKYKDAFTTHGVFRSCHTNEVVREQS